MHRQVTVGDPAPDLALRMVELLGDLPDVGKARPRSASLMAGAVSLAGHDGGPWWVPLRALPACGSPTSAARAAWRAASARTGSANPATSWAGAMGSDGAVRGA